MGIYMNAKVSPLEAELKDGILKAYFNDTVIKECSIPVKSINFPRQCNFLKTPYDRVLGFLYNDDFKLILTDNNYLMVTKSDNRLIAKTKFKTSSIQDFTIPYSFCGYIYISNDIYPVYIMRVGDANYILYCRKYPISILLPTNELTLNILDLVRKSEHCDILRFGITLVKSIEMIYVEFGDGVRYYYKEYKIFRQESFIWRS